MTTDRVVHNGELPLATRDFGGEGAAILLLPGAGQTLADFTPLAELLTGTHHVIAMDMRGHGLSGDAPFTWDGALADAEAVVAAYDVPEAAIVGHSLGGMIAAMYGARHPESRGVVNIDGQGMGAPYQYEGMDPEVVAARQAEMHALTNAAIPSEPQAGPVEVVEAGIAALQATYGIAPELAHEMVWRGVVELDGGYARRVLPTTVREITALTSSLDLPSDYRACKAPLLVFNATAPQAAVPGAPEWLPELLNAYRRGLSLQLAAMAEELPTMTYVQIEATHALQVTHATQVADAVLAFLS